MKQKPYIMKVFTFLQLQELLREFQEKTEHAPHKYSPAQFLMYINTDKKDLDPVEQMVEGMEETACFQKEEFLTHYRAYKKLKEQKKIPA